MVEPRGQDGNLCRWSVKRAERAGFEPAVPVARDTAFPVPHNRPLCHLSDREAILASRLRAINPWRDARTSRQIAVCLVIGAFPAQQGQTAW